MAAPTDPKKNQKQPQENNDLWKDAYTALKEDAKGKKLLKKLGEIIREDQRDQGKPVKKLRSDEGRKQLLAIINRRSSAFASSKSSEKFGKISDLMMNVRDIVAAGAAAGSPFATIAVSGLFMAFSMIQAYQSEKQAMFNTVKAIANIIVRHNTGERAVKKQKGDDKDMRELRTMLQFNYVNLYRSVLEALAKLVAALYSEWKLLRQIFKWDDWPGELAALEKADRECIEYRDEIHRRKDDSAKAATPPNAGFRNGRRNPLHQAAALNLPDKVFDLVTSREYDINALTARKWTALSLAAGDGSLKVVRTLLAAKGINLNLQNDEGRTALHLAAARNQVGVVKLLLGQNAKIDIRDNRGKTPYLLAAKGGHTNVIKALKDKGQKLNETTLANEWTALHLAAEGDRVDTVKYLLANGVRKGTKVKRGVMAGCTAKNIAEKKGSTKVIEFL